MASVKKTKYDTYKVYYRNPTGQSRSLSFKKLSEANAFASTVETSKLTGAYVAPRLGRTRFKDWAEEVMTTRQHLRDSTRARDESCMTSLILPTFGNRRLASITPGQAQGWVNELSQSHAPATVRKAAQLLSLVLGAAVNADMLARTPYRGITLPRIEQTEMRFLQPAEVRVLADAAGNYGTLILTLAATGIRIGEAAALEVGPAGLDLLRRQLRVTQTLNEVRGHVRVGPPKTKAAVRTVTLPQFLVDGLAQHLEDRDSSRVFTAPGGGPLLRSNFRRRVWLPATQEAGLPGLRVHDLRHSHVAQLIAQGEHPRVIANRLGHSSVRTVLDCYGHLMPGMDEAAAARVDAAYSDRPVADLSPIRAGDILQFPTND